MPRPRSRIFSSAMRYASCSRCCCFSRATMSSRVARRTTRCGESPAGRRLSSSCGMRRTTVPTAGPPSVCTTTRSPARGAVAPDRREKRLRPPDRRQLDGDERRAGRAHSCSTSQSATTFTPALRSSAHECAIDRDEGAARRARREMSAPAARAPAGVGLRQHRRSPRRSRARSISRSSDAIARRCEASCSRSLRAAARSSPAAPSRLDAAADRCRAPLRQHALRTSRASTSTSTARALANATAGCSRDRTSAAACRDARSRG